MDQRQVEEFKTRLQIPQGSGRPLPCPPHQDCCPALGAGGKAKGEAEEEVEEKEKEE